MIFAPVVFIPPEKPALIIPHDRKLATFPFPFIAPKVRTETFEGNNGTNIGNMTNLTNAFDGNTSVADGTSACRLNGTNGYCGKNYTSGKAINRVKVYSTTDCAYSNDTGSVTITLYGKNSSPSSGTDGTSLGSAGTYTSPGSGSQIATITPSDNVTTYTYVWINITGGGGGGSVTFAELQIYSIA